MALIVPKRPLRALFVHQNFPGQYAHLAPAMAARKGVQVIAFGEKPGYSAPGVTYIPCGAPKGAGEQTHRYLRPVESAVRRGQSVATKAAELRQKGFVPDIIVGHPGWGEALFLKDVWPNARCLFYWEFYYHSTGQDLGFDPEQPVSLDDAARVRVMNATQLMSLQVADWGVSPTRWQWSRYPDWARRRISVLHEGVDTERCAPDPAASFTLPNGTVLRRGDKVISYVARNLEPYRGFPIFMRALPKVQRRHPDAQIVIVGGNEVSYGKPPPDGGNWREVMLKELEGQLDLSRIHFTGRVPYGDLLALFRTTTVHAYLTYPFVLSWSMLEAMACGALVLGSATPPVQEAIEDGRTGLLTPFFDHEALAQRLNRVLDAPAALDPIRAAARESIIARYDLRSVCLPKQIELVERIAAGAKPEPEPEPE
jgi:glycosyltransferase involved in cell wall biosynthesis